MIDFLIGLFIGAFIGVGIMCLCFVSSKADKKIQQMDDSHDQE